MQRISIQQIQAFEQFYRIPKLFFTSEKYKDMKLESKTAYAILRDRFELSLKNGWVDENQNVYFVYTVAALQEILGCGNKKVIAIKKDLAKFGLLEEERQGFNRANRLYIGSVSDDSFSEKSSESLGDKEVSKRHVRKCQNDTSSSVRMTRPVVSKRHPNDTDLSETDLNQTENKFSGEDDEQKLINKRNSEDSISQNHEQDVELLAEQFRNETNSQLTQVKKRKLSELINRFSGLLVSEAITRAALNDSKSIVYVERICESMFQDEQKRLADFQQNQSSGLTPIVPVEKIF